MINSYNQLVSILWMILTVPMVMVLTIVTVLLILPLLTVLAILVWILESWE